MIWRGGCACNEEALAEAHQSLILLDTACPESRSLGVRQLEAVTVKARAKPLAITAAFWALLAGLLLFYLTAAQAQADEGPTRVTVAIYLLSLGRLDTANGVFTADFYLSFRCDRPCEVGEFEFMNGRATLLDKELDEPTRQDYRVYATLQDNFNLRAYPFDRHDLSIAIEHKVFPIEQLVYLPDRERSGVSPDIIITGWELEPGWDASVEERYFPTFDQTFSHFIFSVAIERAVLASLMKALLPSLIITLSGFLALLLHTPEKAQARTATLGSALVAVVLFHLNMTSSIPPVGYLTFADRFSLINYLALFVGLASSVWMLVEDSRKRVDREVIGVRCDRISRFFLVFTPALWLILQLINLAFR